MIRPAPRCHITMPGSPGAVAGEAQGRKPSPNTLLTTGVGESLRAVAVVKMARDVVANSSPGQGGPEDSGPSPTTQAKGTKEPATT